MGLAILNLLIMREDGTKAPKSESWRDIVRHWMVGEPRLCLYVALKDWPHHYYNRPHGRKFNMKWYQWGVIALEFLNK